MTVVAEQILQSVRQLPESEQRHLAEEILAGLGELQPFELTGEQIAKGRLRIEAYQRDPSRGISRGDLFARLDSQK